MELFSLSKVPTWVLTYDLVSRGCNHLTITFLIGIMVYAVRAINLVDTILTHYILELSYYNNTYNCQRLIGIYQQYKLVVNLIKLFSLTAFRLSIKKMSLQEMSII